MVSPTGVPSHAGSRNLLALAHTGILALLGHRGGEGMGGDGG